VLPGTLEMAEEDKHFSVPFSLRLSFEERAQIERDAAGLPLGRYIRDKVLDGRAQPRRRRGRNPIKDHAALGRVLGALGASRISNNLNQLARAVNSGSLPVTPETEAALKDACRDVKQIRAGLLRALGLSPDEESSADSEPAQP
jgi:hypothetical protein